MYDSMELGNRVSRAAIWFMQIIAEIKWQEIYTPVSAFQSKLFIVISTTTTLTTVNHILVQNTWKSNHSIKRNRTD